MKISNLSLYIVELPFRFSFNHSLAKRSCSYNLIVKATIESKGKTYTGYGEGVPREYVTGETIEQAIEYLVDQYFPTFIDKQFSNTTIFASVLITLPK